MRICVRLVAVFWVACALGHARAQQAESEAPPETVEPGPPEVIQEPVAPLPNAGASESDSARQDASAADDASAQAQALELREEPPTQAAASAESPTVATPALEPSGTITPLEAARVDIHGFVSQGFILTAGNNYLASDSDHGSVEFTEVGVNLTTEPVERLRLGVQLFTRDLGPIGNYEARFDWFYLDYRFADWLGIRVGRTKVPFGLYNEINDIDVARAPILLPQSIYPTTSRDYLLAQSGAELYGLVRLGDVGNLDLRAYAGTVFAALEVAPGSPYQLAGARWPYVAGGRVLWETPLDGLRIGGSFQAFKLHTDLLLTQQVIVPDPMTGAQRVVAVPQFETLTILAQLWLASVEYALGDLSVAAEYGRWRAEIESSDPVLIQGTGSVSVSERMFAMLAYRITPWFQPAVYYSLVFQNVDDRDGRDSRQHDTALTARFDINPYWLFKVEGHFMHGTAALSPTLNDNTPKTELSRNWGLLLLKTTAYF